MADRAVASRRSLEVEFFRMLNRVVEPAVRRGFGSPRLAPNGFIVLETVGRKSGELRRSPLAATRIGRHMIVATFRGDRSQWVRNLVAQPRTRYWTRGVPHETDAFVVREGARIPASLPAPLQRVVRFLVPYTKAGWAFAVLSPRTDARRKSARRPRRRPDARRELRPRRAAHR
jgi:deazaflavin-dependent oxidoreductase (nitroreductase family)